MKLTLSVIGVTTLIFILQLGGIVNDDLSFMPAAVKSKPYIIITSIFMHANTYHLLANMFGLFIFGSIVEEEIGAKKWILLYLTSGVVGNLGYMLLSNPFIPALGASGAIFGLMGAAAVLRPRQIIYTPYGPFPMSVAAVIWTISEIISFFGVDNIAQSAHIFGILSGIAIILIMKKESNIKIPTAFFGASLIAVYLLSFAMPHSISIPNLDCDELHSIDEINFKEKLYNCSDNIVLIASYPAAGKINPADYYNKFPQVTESVYQSITNNQCTAEVSKMDISNGEVLSDGTICEYNFKDMAKNCGYNRIEVVQLFDKNPKIEAINC